VDDLCWVVSGSNVNQVVTKPEGCAASSIEWASRRGLQLNSAKTEAARFTLRRGDKKQLQQKLTARIRVGDSLIRFNREATWWLGILSDPLLTLKEHSNRCMKKARAAEARLANARSKKLK
jgi:hypothetical protein